MRKSITLTTLFLVTVVSVPALTIAAIQFEVDNRVYSSAEQFESNVLSYLDQCKDVDLVIFPEYTSAFTAAFLGGRSRDALLESSQTVRSYLDDFWTEQAIVRGQWILAGTYLEADSGQLYNTALLYTPEGDEILHQRKCFLGYPETEFGISSETIRQVEPFIIGDKSLVLTICRDTYHSIWEEYLPKVDLWIDIKANELRYTEEYYADALPSRLPKSPIDRGLTVSLVGEMIGYEFEGITSLISDERTLKCTRDPQHPDILIFHI